MKNFNTERKYIPFIIFSKIQLRISAILIITIIYLSACSGLTNELESPITSLNGYSEAFLALDTTTVMDLTEEAYLLASHIDGPITIAEYFPAKNIMMAIYGSDGFLRAWKIEESSIEFEHDLGVTSSTSIGFDKSGDLMMGPIRNIVQENDYGELVEIVGGIAIWKTNSGELVTCAVYPCERSAPLEQWQRHLISGAVFDPQGQWVISNYETLVSILDISDLEVPYSVSLNDIDGNNREVALLTIDSNNDRFATAFKDGGILIQGLGEKNLSFFAPKIRLGTYQTRSRHKVVALGFSADGQWLARLQEGILSIWRVSTRSGNLYSEYVVPDGQILVFDQSSKLLFIGTTGKIDVWDIEKKKLIREIITPEITSLAVSSDNTLVVWGDKFGAVHVWGVRK